jgi:hypothetical protein
VRDVVYSLWTYPIGTVGVLCDDERQASATVHVRVAAPAIPMFFPILALSASTAEVRLLQKGEIEDAALIAATLLLEPELARF